MYQRIFDFTLHLCVRVRYVSRKNVETYQQVFPIRLTIIVKFFETPNLFFAGFIHLSYSIF